MLQSGRIDINGSLLRYLSENMSFKNLVVADIQLDHAFLYYDSAGGLVLKF